MVPKFYVEIPAPKNHGKSLNGVAFFFNERGDGIHGKIRGQNIREISEVSQLEVLLLKQFLVGGWATPLKNISQLG